MGTVPLGAEARFGVFRSTPGVVLVALLTLLIVASAALRRDVEQLSPRELSYLLAGHSIAYDFDVRFSESDRSRSEALSLPVESLLLRSVSGSEDRFDVPIAYPLVMAPFVRIAPLRGALIANAILLGLAAMMVAYRLGKHLGQNALALVAICLFASVIYRSAFLVQPASLLMALIALALSVVFRHEEPGTHGVEEVYRPAESPVGGGGRNLVVGVLIGIVATHHPLFFSWYMPAGWRFRSGADARACSDWEWGWDGDPRHRRGEWLDRRSPQLPWAILSEVGGGERRCRRVESAICWSRSKYRSLALLLAPAVAPRIVAGGLW